MLNTTCSYLLKLKAGKYTKRENIGKAQPPPAVMLAILMGKQFGNLIGVINTSQLFYIIIPHGRIFTTK